MKKWEYLQIDPHGISIYCSRESFDRVVNFIQSSFPELKLKLQDDRVIGILTKDLWRMDLVACLGDAGWELVLQREFTQVD